MHTQKKLLFWASLAMLTLLLGACANAPSTAEQAATGCPAPTMDNTAREVDGSCISGDKEQIRLEGVKVTGTERLYVYADATAGDGTKGWEFTFDATTNRIWVKNTVNGQFMSSQNFTLSTADTYCIDIHRGSEDPRHIIIWKGAAKCDATLSSGQWGSADFNSNDHAASGSDYAARNISNPGGTIYTNSHSTGMAPCNSQNACFAAGNNPDTQQGGTKFFYKGPFGSLSKIEIKNHRSSGL
jgi:hypothetical protein